MRRAMWRSSSLIPGASMSRITGACRPGPSGEAAKLGIAPYLVVTRTSFSIISWGPRGVARRGTASRQAFYGGRSRLRGPCELDEIRREEIGEFRDDAPASFPER